MVKKYSYNIDNIWYQNLFLNLFFNTVDDGTLNFKKIVKYFFLLQIIIKDWILFLN